MTSPTSTTPRPATPPQGEQPVKIYPRTVTGPYASWRWAMVWLTQLFFYGMPWLSWNGRQALLFDLSERRFYVLGMVLQPQDFIYLAVLLVISALALFFFTAIAGRLWCGYSCPQTVYTELFLWIERRVEGDRSARMRLDAQPWGWTKLWRKGSKHGLWLALALFTGFSFVGYFSPIRELLPTLSAPSEAPWLWFWVLFYAAATYGNAGFLREQMCKFMCPYARFQSALIDMDSLVIAYDTARGESRGPRSRKTEHRSAGLGDCVDCTLCVQVCPTGIDIRDGLQNECIACAACIDVCNGVMDRMGYEKGLIRYTSGRAVASGWGARQMLARIWRPRVIVYGLLLLLLGGAWSWSLSQRQDFDASLTKDRGSLARLSLHGGIENTYRLQVTNNREQARDFELRLDSPYGVTIDSETRIRVQATDAGALPLRLVLPAEAAAAHAGRTLDLHLIVVPSDSSGGTLRRLPARFTVPR
ncbi:MAG TPA: cytochrome c oxidase accessory protein CcoG [Hydrogenophaga sp.]|uniref:cytochrome c oxidase accessory protein CcoG n=1 Tax=Hydrogenophaga sp. TaxID=1904254 RepID=UPI002CFAE72F|nr:cytochrome c oxidase accessory protein CcoG [Hydrogenophaga sp.]HMN94101.1 cytochrome c oxidase accessory protein CcoG [Hydrogenophaga sp.]HMP10871.1 cytochrome c oxidase accessory protein CcoG [Hydrogenophaga sp.]